MQAYYAERFEREMGCTATELAQRLPGAADGRPLRIGDGAAEVSLETGRLILQWVSLPARRIALLALPCLRVNFAFDGVEDEARQRFMRRFDLYMQRGGG